MKGIFLGLFTKKRIDYLKETFTANGIEMDRISSAELDKQIQNGKLIRPLSQYWDFCVLGVLSSAQQTKICNMLTEDGVRLFNTVSATNICKNKWITYRTLLEHNIPQMKTCATYYDFTRNEFDNNKTVVKPRLGKQGKDIFICANKSEVLAATQKLKSKRETFIIQKFCETANNRIVRVYCIRDKGVGGYVAFNPNSCIVNLAQEATRIDEEIPQSFIALAEKAARIVGTDLCAVDLLYGENGSPIVCEINSMPGLGRQTAESGGLNLAQLFVEHIINEILKNKNIEV